MKPLSFRLYKTYLILFAITGISLLSISNVYSFLSGKISSSLFPDISFINIHGNLTLESLRATGSEGIKELKDSKGKVLRFTDEALDEIVKANTDQDFGVFPEVEGAAELSPVNHFDSESIRSSSELLKRNKDVIVKLLSADCPDGATARKNLGRALHALQDFYSHTNWVELGFSSINRKLGREIFGLSTQEQSKLVVSSDGERLLPDVIFSLNENKLTSGYYPAVPTTPDPRSGIKIRHGEALVNNFTSPGLNKDGPSRTGFGEARRLAGLATIDFLNQIIDEIPEKNRVKGISSLMGLGQGVTFVVDTTGSMGDEIDGVIAKIAELVDDATSEIVLQTFNDPEVPAARKFCDVGEFLSALASISVSGGDDCPEQSNLGVYRAVAASGEKSKVYVFTDASNKSSLSRSAITSAAKAKKITIEFLLTGSCSPIDPDYYAIAQETGGNVYSLFEGGIGIEKISEGIKEDLTNKFQLITHISAINSGTERNIDIPVDSSITRLVLSAGSDGASVDFRSPGGAVIVPGPNVNIQIGESGDTILIIDRPAVGTWLSKITGNGPYSFSAKGVSDYKLVDVAYGKLQPSHHSEVEEFAVFSGDPPPSRPTITRFQFIGDLREVVTYLERSDGTQINSTTLPKIDYGGGMVGDVFFGTTTPPAEKFNFVVVGKNAASEPVQRQWPLQFSPSNISIEPVFPLFEVSRGTVRPIEFKVTNFGGGGSFIFTGESSIGAIVDGGSQIFDLASGEVKSVEIKFLISTEGNFGDGVNISGSVSRRDDVSVFNSATSLGIIFQDSSAGTISGKSQPILNRQTGLFTQGLDLQIVGSGIRIIVDGLPPGVVLYNRTGIDAEGRPYIQVNSSISGLVSVVLEYHVPNGAPINPTFTLAPFGIIDQPNLSGRIPIGVDKIVPLASGVMIEFTTQQGKHYIIQFSEDMVSWITSGQAILAGGNRVQWIDQGPPKTPSSPVGGSRFYRVIQQD